MRLIHAHNSPYARRTVLAARLSGLDIEEVDVSTEGADRAALLSGGPGAKVPGLEVDGAYLCETLVITNYLNRKCGGKLLDEVDAGLRELEGLGSLLTDCLYVRSHEIRKADDGKPSPSLIAKETARINGCYDALDRLLSGRKAEMNLATFAVIAGLGYANWRGADDNWRDGRDGLAAWYDAMMENRDVADTAPIF